METTPSATPYSYEFYRTTSEAWDAMSAAIRGAARSIFWEIFIFVDDLSGRPFVDALIERAKAGVEVKLIIDAFGSFNFSVEAERRLRAAGVEVLRFNRLYPELRISRWISRLWFRNHRKVLIVDETVVFLGGVNIHSDFREWDDLYLKIVGPVARPLLRGFAKSYIASGGERKNIKHFLHHQFPDGWRALREKFKFIMHSPRLSRVSLPKQLYMRALTAAKESVNFLSPYFIPDRKFLQAVTLAKKRGVKVNIFLPLRTDHKLMELIARAYYGLTIRAGADIYLLPKMNHGKAITMDDRVGLVGSINITPRSFDINEESGVFFNDEKMVGELNKLFNSWKETAKPVDELVWQKRGRWNRFKEWLARWLEKYV